MRSRGIAVVVCFLACLGPIPGGAGTRDPDLAQLAAPPPSSPPAVAGPQAHLGTVLETMDAGRYTYVRVDTGDGAIWAAGPQTRVGVGDTVFLPAGMAVANFESSTLLRRFDLLYLVSFIEVRRSAAPHPAAETPAPDRPAPDGAAVERVAGGATVAEILEGRV